MRDQPKNGMVVAILAVATRADHAMDKRDEEVKQYQVPSEIQSHSAIFRTKQPMRCMKHFGEMGLL